MGQYADDLMDYQLNGPRHTYNSYVNRSATYDFTRVEIDGILRETEKAYQFKKDKYSFWVPKALCRELETSSVLIYKDFDVTFVEIVTADDINNMFDVIEDEEPDFIEVLTHLNFPTPFD